MTFPAPNLMKQTIAIAAASRFIPRPVKNVVAGTRDHRGPKRQSKEEHGAKRTGLGGKENGPNWRIGDPGGERMQEDVFSPLPAQPHHVSNHDQPFTASMRRQFAKENPRAVYMAIGKKDARSQVLNASSNAIENSSFSGSRLVPYSIMKAERGEARGHKGKNKQSGVFPSSKREDQNRTSQQASSWFHRMDENVFGTRPTKVQSGVHPSRASAFVNSDSPINHFVLQHLDFAHDSSSFFPDGHDYNSSRADPDRMDVDIDPLSTPTLSYEFWWRRDSLNNDVEMEESGRTVQQEDVVMEDIEASFRHGQDEDIEMAERSPVFPAYPVQANMPTFPAFPPAPAFTQVFGASQEVPSFDTDVHMEDATAEPDANLYGEPMDVDIEYTIVQPPVLPVTSNTPTPFSIQDPTPPSAFPHPPDFTTTMALHYTGPPSSSPVYPLAMNHHGFNTPLPLATPPSRQRRKTCRHRGTPPYSLSPAVRTKTGTSRDRVLTSGFAGAHPRRNRSRLCEGLMPLDSQVALPQPSPLPFALITPTSSSIHPTSGSSFPNYPPSAITMAPHCVEQPLIPNLPTPITPTPFPIQLTTTPSVFPNLPSSTTTMAPTCAGLLPYSPANPFVRHYDEAPLTESLAIGLDTPSSPSPPNPRRRKIHRDQGPFPHAPTPSLPTKTGIYQDRASKSLSLASANSRRGSATSRAQKNGLNGAQLRRRL